MSELLPRTSQPCSNRVVFLLDSRSVTMKIQFFTVALVLVVAFVLFRLNRTAEPESQILADVGAEIEVVICSATSARTSSLRNSELVANIVNGLPDSVQVLLLVSDRASFETNSGNNRVKFIELPKKTDISIWPQDPFIVVGTPDHKKLITPCVFDREDDHIMPIGLGEMLDIPVIRSELHFEGGNIVSGEEAVFIGFNTIAINSKLLEVDAAVIRSKFQKLFGRRVIVVGEEQQEVTHIDLVFTPLPGNRIAIADSRLGASLMQNLLDNNPEEMASFEQQAENNFFGRADITELADQLGNSIVRPAVVGKAQENIKASIAAGDQLDAIAQQMSEAGYEVERVPALVPDLTLQRKQSGKEKTNYPFLTYNNVLLEERNGTSVVYLPQFDCPTLDNAAAERWAEMGFKVKTISGFSTSAMYGGALRCCTKVLLRKPSSK